MTKTYKLMKINIIFVKSSILKTKLSVDTLTYLKNSHIINNKH